MRPPNFLGISIGDFVPVHLRLSYRNCFSQRLLISALEEGSVSSLYAPKTADIILFAKSVLSYTSERAELCQDV